VNLTAVIALNATMDIALLAALAYVLRVPFRLDRRRLEPSAAEPQLELAA
jgi:hypothetical protein